MRNCHVRHLTVQAATTTAAQQGARLVEDGLRTASLPGESSQLLIVRRLDIGALRAGANPIAVAQQIEQALARLPVQAVAATDPAAGSASAVYFADEVEACVQLAIHAARGLAPTAWFLATRRSRLASRLLSRRCHTLRPVRRGAARRRSSCRCARGRRAAASRGARSRARRAHTR